MQNCCPDNFIVLPHCDARQHHDPIFQSHHNILALSLPYPTNTERLARKQQVSSLLSHRLAETGCETVDSNPKD